MNKKIGFIGLGAMGKFMAENLLKAGYILVLYDKAESALLPFKGYANAELAGSVAEVGKKTINCITMLPNTPHVEEVILGADGLHSTMVGNSLIIDMSSIAPNNTIIIAETLKKKGIDFLDAPVSGGQKGAREGTLSIMVGGEKGIFEKALKILSIMGRNIVHMGPAGSGQTAKICNQIIVGMNIHAVCESFALARSAGMDLEILRNVLMGGAANSWMLENLAPMMLKGDTSAGFRITLQLKDLRLALDTGFENAVPLPGTALVANLYTEAIAHGEANNGNQALFKVFERLSGN